MVATVEQRTHGGGLRLYCSALTLRECETESRGSDQTDRRSQQAGVAERQDQERDETSPSHGWIK